MQANTDDWALRTNLQLCGSVSPPTYADLRTAAHLQTFDVCDGGAALWSDSGKIFLVKVLHQSKQAKPFKDQILKHVTLDPPLQPHEAAEVEQIKLNASGSQALLVAKSWLKVVRLPAKNEYKQSSRRRETENASQRLIVRFEDDSEQEITLKKNGVKDQENITEQVKQHVSAGSKRVAFVSREVSVVAVRSVGYFGKIRHAAWHPLSDTHIIVMSDAEEIEVFNTQQDVSKAEQRHRLDFPAKARVAGAFSSCFCFGASIQLQHQQSVQMQRPQLWDAFTCYVLRSDGAVYALCPLVPYECCVSKAFLQDLGTEVDAQIALCKQKVETAGSVVGMQTRLAELKSQKYWLQEGWAPVSAQVRRNSSRSGVRKYDNAFAEIFCFLGPHMSGISPDTWPLALQGPVEVFPQSNVERKNQKLEKTSAASLLSVPLASRNIVEKRAASMSPFLMRTFTSGHVELILLDAPIRPQWRSSRQPAAANAVRKYPALLLECLNIGIDNIGGKAVLERDDADPRLVYCLHSTGVHVINVSWVFALASGKQFTTLPKSSVRPIFSVSPGSSSSLSTTHTAVSNIVGARVVKNVDFGHLLLLRLASGNFEVINISAASSELLKGVFVNSPDDLNFRKTLPDTLASMASRGPLTASSSNSTVGDVRSFGEIVEEKLEILSARGTRVTGKTLMHEVDDAVVAFVIERIKVLYEDVEYVDEMDQLIRDRLHLLTTMVQTQSEKVVVVQKNVDEARLMMKKLEDKMERALVVQKNLSKRAAAVLQAVKENQPRLSRAEREFKSELDRMAIEVRRLKPRVAELTVECQRAVRSLETKTLSASSSRPYWNSLGGASSSGITSEKKKICYDVLRAETQLIDDTKILLENLSANVQHLKE
ncbi:Nuclear pore complex, Nup88/rNup84 component [Plasmopara halstedii]|uniref:Nuclear pore complex, Nup88/rNup84 component n=1 Tax=Plasmopara halstedii TaxID=4781 RepID=A0A0N7L7A4_PLAHL|nr:Nuclear pore complex, Nup88/rNup84 component [Plasmopara halstedii]CEG46523.1 Nuclear pore complex, Nup88/rNup84 component [Plasmopara halstedii]|eukprot:XP_024582892.1 Nuclear pore complex, Nup88/rNup84 component [Plasmopara halstedii]